MKKSKMITIIAVVALVAIIAATLVAGTFARYATTVTATTEASTAAWTVTAGFGNEHQDTINLYDTIEDPSANYPNLTENTIAPGTSGTFNAIIDGTGSEVGIDYSVKIEKAEDSDELPKGLTFTIGGQQYTADSEEPITVKGLIPLTDVGTPVTIPVTWEWVLGEDATAEEGLDNGNASKNLYMNVTIRCEQHIGPATQEIVP